MTARTDEHPVLTEIRNELERRQSSYYAVGNVADVHGWERWARAARNAAWCRLLADSWDRLAEFGARHDPRALGTLAASYAVAHHQAQREHWRELARIAATERCPERESGGVRCRHALGHPGRHAPRDDRS